MKKLSVQMFVLMLLCFAFFIETRAQVVSVAVKQEIRKQLSCERSQQEIESVKLGPGKDGFMGTCNGGGEAVLYEKSGRGIKKVLESSTQMNGSMQLGKKVYLGYYEVIVEAHGAAYFNAETFRWNGARYVSNRCEMCDVTSQGDLRNCRPC